jgi:hypothetical protein
MVEAFFNEKEERIKREVENAKKYLQLEGTVLIVALSLKYILSLELPESQEGNKPPKDRASMLLKEIRDEVREKRQIEEQQKFLFQNLKLNEERNFNKPYDEKQKETLEKKEKEVFKENRIKEQYALLIYDPETDKVDVIKEEKLIVFSTLEQKIVEESLAMKNDEKVFTYLAEPLIKKEPEEIKEQTIEAMKKSEKEKGFGKDPYSKLVVNLDQNIDEKPENINEALKRKEKLIEETEKIQKLIDEALNAAKQRNEAMLREKINKFPPLLRERAELLLKQKRDKLIAFLQLESLFLKALNDKIRRAGTKTFINTAKNIVVSIMANVVKMFR